MSAQAGQDRVGVGMDVAVATIGRSREWPLGDRRPLVVVAAVAVDEER